MTAAALVAETSGFESDVKICGCYAHLHLPVDCVCLVSCSLIGFLEYAFEGFGRHRYLIIWRPSHRVHRNDVGTLVLHKELAVVLMAARSEGVLGALVSDGRRSLLSPTVTLHVFL